MQGTSSESETDGRRYTVERVVQKRLYNGRTEYFVKWKGYPESQNTWESSKNLQSCADLIAEFEAGKSPTPSSGPESLHGVSSPSPEPRTFTGDMKRLVTALQQPEASRDNFIRTGEQGPNPVLGGLAKVLKPGTEVPTTSRPHESLLKTSLREAEKGTATGGPAKSDGKTTPGETTAMTPTKVVGLRRVPDGTFEYALECVKEGAPPFVFSVSSREFAKGLPGLVIDFYQKNLSFKARSAPAASPPVVSSTCPAAQSTGMMSEPMTEVSAGIAK